MKSATVSKTSSKPWIWEHRFWFTASITAASFLLYITAYGLGFVPTALTHNQIAAKETAHNSGTTQTNLDDLESTVEAPTDELPVRIRIPSINIDTQIANPASKRVQTLNRYLADSAVRYPESGMPGNGNMFVFGHSSGLESVINQAYKTFNRLEELSAGDVIFVTTQSGTFSYVVSDVEFKRDSAAYVPFSTEQDMLTIATCDNFGAKEDRIVVRAEYTGYTPHRVNY